MVSDIKIGSQVSTITRRSTPGVNILLRSSDGCSIVLKRKGDGNKRAVDDERWKVHLCRDYERLDGTERVKHARYRSRGYMSFTRTGWPRILREVIHSATGMNTIGTDRGAL